MFKRSIVVLVVAGGLVSAESRARAGDLTETEALARFDRESPIAAALAARLEGARAEARARGLMSNPSVTLSREDAGASRDDFLIVEQTVPLTGRRRIEERAGEAAARSEEAEAAHTLARIRGEFRRGFVQLLLAQERRAVLEESAGRYLELTRMLREREEEGEGSRFDRIRAEKELAEARAELESGAADVVKARRSLASWLAPGTDGDELAAAGSLASGRTIPPLADLIPRALAARGDHRAAVERMEQWRDERRAARRRWVPEPVLAAGLKRVRAAGETPDTGFVISVNVPVPLFDRGRERMAWAAAAERRESVDLGALAHRIATEVKVAHASAEASRRAAEDYALAVQPHGDELARIARVAYQEGEQGILELLDAEKSALSAKLRVLELRAAARAAEIDLDLAVGEEVSR